MQNVKAVVIGDEKVGKTAVIASFADWGSIPDAHLPSVYNNVAHQIAVDDKYIHIGIWDTSSGAAFDRLRPLSYPRTDVFLLLYDVSNKETLQHLQSKWLPEKEHHCPSASFGVVGCKTDLRERMQTMPVNDEMDETRLKLVVCHCLRQHAIALEKVEEMVVDMIVAFSQCSESRQKFVRYEDGEQMARMLGACGYVECSAYSEEGVRELFEEACRWALGPDRTKKLFQKSYDRKQKKDCAIL